MLLQLLELLIFIPIPISLLEWLAQILSYLIFLLLNNVISCWILQNSSNLKVHQTKRDRKSIRIHDRSKWIVHFHIPSRLAVADQLQCEVELWVVHLNVLAFDLIDWKNVRWQNHCLPSMLMALAMMYTHSQHYFEALVIDVTNVLPYSNGPLPICQPIASIVSVHFHAVLIPVVQVPVIVRAAIAVWVAFERSVLRFWMSDYIIQMNKQNENEYQKYINGCLVCCVFAANDCLYNKFDTVEIQNAGSQAKDNE